MADRRPRRSAAQTREHVLQTAEELFYWEGIRATGVDKVAARAEVGPTTLYRLFASKDDLVAAYVDRLDEGYRAWIAEVTAPEVGSPRERILSLFRALVEVVGPDDCRGCPFLMTLAEFPDSASGAHAHAVATKAWVRDRIRELVEEHHEISPVRDPGLLADGLTLVMEGVYGSVQALTVSGPAARACDTAAQLIDAA